MQCVDGLHLRGLVCRIQPEDHADGKAEDRRERNNAAAERKLHAGVRRDGRGKPQDAPRKKNSDDAPEHAENDRFHQKLQQYGAAVRADGLADADLARALRDG